MRSSTKKPFVTVTVILFRSQVKMNFSKSVLHKTVFMEKVQLACSRFLDAHQRNASFIGSAIPWLLRPRNSDGQNTKHRYNSKTKTWTFGHEIIRGAVFYTIPKPTGLSLTKPLSDRESKAEASLSLQVRPTYSPQADSKLVNLSKAWQLSDF